MLCLFTETGFYVPKAYYTIDEHGYKSPLIYIDNIPVSIVGQCDRSGTGSRSLSNYICKPFHSYRFQQIFQRTRRSAQLPPGEC